MKSVLDFYYDGLLAGIDLAFNLKQLSKEELYDLVEKLRKAHEVMMSKECKK